MSNLEKARLAYELLQHQRWLSRLFVLSLLKYELMSSDREPFSKLKAKGKGQYALNVTPAICVKLCADNPC